MTRKIFAREGGAMLVTMSVLLLLIVCLAAVAVDVGHLMIVRNELQNAADAAALAGANCLDKTSAPSGTDCTATTQPTLNWAVASAKASSAIALNKADGTTLASATVATGYKNLSGTPAGLQPATLSPITANDRPAVMVTVSRSAGVNGGPVQTLVTNMFGGAAVPVSAQAIAVISAPGNVPPGNLIPQAINQCMFNLYWNSATNSPQLATSATLNGVPQTIGQPWELRIGSSYHYPNCDSGQWTSFNQDANSQSAIKGLIANGNPDPMNIGDNTWIEPGTKTASYNDLLARYPVPPGADVVLVVVNIPNGLNTQGATPIVAFAGFHIDDIQGGSNKYIQGHFITGGTVTGSSGSGTYYGSYTPPRLAQ